MDKRFLWLSLAAVAISFAGGFLLANALNRAELTALRSENERLKTDPSASGPNEAELTAEEIRSKISEADSNPGNFQFQKTLGLGLYRYAAMKKDTDLLSEAARLLDRASELQKEDHDVLIGLGNAYFDIGYFKKDNASFERSREFYQKALQKKPDDAETRTDLGLTYFLQEPPDDDKALTEFRKSLSIDPKHEKTLQFTIQTLLRQKKIEEAGTLLARLREVNPANETLAALAGQVGNSDENIRK